MNFNETSGFSRYDTPVFLMAYVGNISARLLVSYKCSWNWIFYCECNLTVWLESWQLEGVGPLVFGEVFRALHVLNLFSLTGETSTWLQRSLCPTPHPGVQVQSCTCLAQKCPQDQGKHVFGERTASMCGIIMRNGDWCRMKLGTRRGMGEIYKGPLHWIKK